jgi:multidrug efflux pump
MSGPTDRAGQVSSLSALFIHRPIATTLLTLAIALAGVLGFALLPVAPLPQVDYPTIQVSANLPGANPETMASSVATPLERALGRIAGVTEMTSYSGTGYTRITLQFDLDRSIDGAARSVQAAINASRALLPTGMPGNPTYRKVNPADSPVMILALTSPTHSRGQMYDAASTFLAQTISQVKGVGQVDVGGSSLPAVRVTVNPQALNTLGLGVEDVRTAITAANANRPQGIVENERQRWQLGATDQTLTAAELAPTIVRWQNGSAVRLSDVATVRDSVQDVRNAGFVNGEPAVVVLIRRQPAANVIETVDTVRAQLPMLEASLPPGMQLRVVTDATRTIRASLTEVEHSLVISVALVVMVVMLFLRKAWAALVPAVAVPVSLLGALAVMKLCGLSINNLSLMALTVATGFVVDDAVVVLENIARHVERGMKPFEAALKGAREVGFTVVSMSLSLVAVFIPILFMGGIVGRLFQEFALTLSVAIAVSLLVSLTTTPMMAARLLKAPKAGVPPPPEPGSPADVWWRRGYARSLGWTLRHPWFTGTLLLATIALNVWLYVIVPKGFLPQQDNGRLTGGLAADETVSFEALQGKLKTMMALVQADPAVAHVVGFTSTGQRSSANVFIDLKPLAERDAKAEEIISRLRKKLSKVPGAALYLQAQQDIRVGGRSANAQYQYTLQAGELGLLREWEPRIRKVLSKLPELTDVNTDVSAGSPQVSIEFNREAAARLGVNVRQLDNTLNDLYGQRQVSTLFKPLNQYKVVLEAGPDFTRGPASLDQVFLSSSTGAQVPLSAIARWRATLAPSSVNHQGQFAATTISFNLPEGVALSEARAAATQAIEGLNMPTGLYGSFQGTAKAFEAATSNQPMLVLAAIVAVYIVLGMLYESLVHPITILSTLPSAGVGALLALMAMETDFSLIAFIGVILLVGIVKKNAIMMIDFALEARRTLGLDAREAIHRAAVLRLRPILMTSVAAMLGALPLVIGGGEGAELRQPLGIAIVGGLLLSQVLTLYTTPVVFLGLERLRERVAGWRARRRARPLAPPVAQP